MNQQVASKLANSVRQAKESQTTANTEIEKKPATAQAAKDDDAPLPFIPSSRRVWPD